MSENATVIVNNTQQDLVMKVGNHQYFVHFANLAKGAKKSLRVDYCGTYQEFLLGADNAGNKLIVTSDECCDYQCITITEKTANSMWNECLAGTTPPMEDLRILPTTQQLLIPKTIEQVKLAVLEILEPCKHLSHSHHTIYPVSTSSTQGKFNIPVYYYGRSDFRPKALVRSPMFVLSGEVSVLATKERNRSSKFCNGSSLLTKFCFDLQLSIREFGNYPLC